MAASLQPVVRSSYSNSLTLIKQTKKHNGSNTD